MRTRFGRISKRKSGDGAKELTDRDSWILEAFSFLRKHIVRVASRQGVSVSFNILYVKYINNKKH